VHIHQHIREANFLIVVLSSRTEVEDGQFLRERHNRLFLEQGVSIRNLVEKLDGYFAGTTDSWRIP